MTPEEYLARLEQLVVDGHDREAVEFSAEFGPAVRSQLTAEQLEMASAMVHGALMAVKLEEWAEAQQETRAHDIPLPKRVV